MKHQKKPLYRKVNRRPQYHRHAVASESVDAKNERGAKGGMSKKMTKKKHGYDYTPLYKFLLSKVGQKWDEIYAEAKDRLDKEEPIFRLVSLSKQRGLGSTVRMGESTYYSTLFVDDDGLLQKVEPNYNVEHFQHVVNCACCTWTFNGIVVPLPKNSPYSNKK